MGVCVSVTDRVCSASHFPQQTRGRKLHLIKITSVARSAALQVLAKMREIIGFAGGDSIFAPGGSICNMYALLVARHKVGLSSIHIST